jgi:hypothetical protein
MKTLFLIPFLLLFSCKKESKYDTIIKNGLVYYVPSGSSLACA